MDDDKCVYDWSSLSCTPEASCSLQYQLGDVTPSQACRLSDTSNATKVPQQLHLAFAGREAGTVVGGLKANTKYFYKVGNAKDKHYRGGLSSFTTARAAGDESPFTVAVYGDMGADDNSVATNKYVNSLVDEVDFVYHLGDISYADNAFLTAKNVFGFYYEQVYNKFMNSMTNVMRQMAYMVLVGNHEAECHSPTCLLSKSKKDQLGNYSAFNSCFRMPSPESGGVLNMWYSYEYGTVHFTTLSIETDYANAPSNAYFTKRVYGGFGDQLVWLEEDLKAADANRDNVPWIIVGMHRPMYTIRSCGPDGVPNNDYEARNVQEAFEELFIKYKVDLVLQGHVHTYERLYPTANNSAIMDGVSRDNKTYENPKHPCTLLQELQEAQKDSNPTNLTLVMIESATGIIHDEFSVIKSSATQDSTQ
ncbi:hypothetical protein PR002_g12967 [Phytophthora rubi]|uniref:Calcineurin-like phosphoesterase domain-containing protein n=1 Tax=Phytophthora rubi TaxID=129364 RepID=A0A6A3LHQ4_9STRA|nr:hypothetical protein PR002_g12967 [Phytophthora rubi]